MGSFLYDRDLRLERVKWKHGVHCVKYEILSVIYSLIWIGRGSCSEVFCIKGVLEKFAKFSGKHLCQSLFLNKIAGLRPATLLKKKLWHRCFPVKFAKFPRKPFHRTPLGDCFWQVRFQDFWAYKLALIEKNQYHCYNKFLTWHIYKRDIPFHYEI